MEDTWIIKKLSKKKPDTLLDVGFLWDFDMLQKGDGYAILSLDSEEMACLTFRQKFLKKKLEY